jgi:hypothetical protein
MTAPFVDPYLLSTTLVMTILLIIGNLYVIAYYSHHADNGFGSSAACKFIIVSISENKISILKFSL